MTPEEPTHDQCSDGASITLPDGRVGYAAWYPSMGGYVSHCVIDPGDGCVDVYVWHNGRFPFSDGRPPVVLHHCVAEQFIAFGQAMAAALEESP